ncbi:MAG: phosphatase PAP2 family protein [Clostridia bacterium]|nr:phosphatase PAP2 family protein [Clostridia bacterium]
MDLTIMRWLQQIQADWLDNIVLAITQLGGTIGTIGIIAVVYFCLNKRAGEFLLFNFSVSVMVNNVAKDIVQRPRPVGQEGIYSNPAAVEDITMADGRLSTSFPSGHSQGISSIASGISINYRRPWLTALCVTVALLVGYSRIYLGVHYPSDVLVGLLLGAGITFLSWFVFNRFYEKRLWIYCGLALLCLPLLLLKSYNTAKMIGLLWGFAISMIIDERFVHYEAEGAWWRRLLRMFIALGVALGFRIMLKAVFPSGVLFEYLRYFIMVLAALGLCPWLYKVIKL